MLARCSGFLFCVQWAERMPSVAERCKRGSGHRIAFVEDGLFPCTRRWLGGARREKKRLDESRKREVGESFKIVVS